MDELSRVNILGLKKKSKTRSLQNDKAHWSQAYCVSKQTQFVLHSIINGVIPA